LNNAARCAGQDINLKDRFLEQEDEDEDTSAVTDTRKAMAAKWPNAWAFSAADAARVINDQSEYASTIEKECGASMREFLFRAIPPSQLVTPRSLGKRLKCRVGEPVKVAGRTAASNSIELIRFSNRTSAGSDILLFPAALLLYTQSMKSPITFEPTVRRCRTLQTPALALYEGQPRSDKPESDPLMPADPMAYGTFARERGYRPQRPTGGMSFRFSGEGLVELRACLEACINETAAQSVISRAAPSVLSSSEG
jgi:hypothetical protein